MLGIVVDSKIGRGLLLAFFLGASSVALAAEDAGTVISSSGRVTAGSAGQKRPLKQGGKIFVNDRITTGDKGFVTLQLMDGARVTLFPYSAVLIENYLYRDSTQDAATLHLQSGGLRIVAGAMAQSNPGGFKVRTPVALMVVRGSEFAIALCGNQICTEGETQN